MSNIPTVYAIPFSARTLYSEEDGLCYVRVEYSCMSPFTGIPHNILAEIDIFKGTKEEFTAKFHADIEVDGAIMEKFDLKDYGEGLIKKELRKEYEEAEEATKNPFDKAFARVNNFRKSFTANIDFSKY
jgi:hypothetical protein